MAHRAFDEQMEALDGLKSTPLDDRAVELIRKSLGHKSNFLVAKAAGLAESHGLVALLPHLLTAFDRFFVNAEKTDPQCWAKNALSRALTRLECRDSEVFLRGLRHHQWEPTWGGRSDSAGTLRGNCAHALIGCEGITNQEILILLVDLLADHDKSVRVEAVRAMSQLGEAAVSVLRLRALIPGEDAEVLGSCFNALLAIEREASIPFVGRFLAAGDDAAGEAAFALSETRSSEALHALLAARAELSRAADPWYLATLLSAIALTRLPEGVDYLVGMVERDEREAPLAIEALARLAPNAELRERVDRAVEEVGGPRLRKALLEQFPPA